MNGHLDSAMFVCHKCDNPRCVNPDHMFLGSNSDNVRDKVQKGRQFSKLKEHEVIEIRRLHVPAGEGHQTIKENSSTDLARKFGITPSNVNAIIQRRTWSHI